uniref:Uncharacterized protein n=1 Tax=Anguilla anguilla TaxID=7936 RepID=A0A0E9X0A0_ANGAN
MFGILPPIPSTIIHHYNPMYIFPLPIMHHFFGHTLPGIHSLKMPCFLKIYYYTSGIPVR